MFNKKTDVFLITSSLREVQVPHQKETVHTKNKAFLRCEFLNDRETESVHLPMFLDHYCQVTASRVSFLIKQKHNQETRRVFPQNHGYL